MLQKEKEGEESAKPLPLVDCLKALAAAWEGVDEVGSRQHRGDYCAHLAMALNPGVHAWHCCSELWRYILCSRHSSTRCISMNFHGRHGRVSETGALLKHKDLYITRSVLLQRTPGL